LEALVWYLLGTLGHGFLQTRLMVNIGLFSVQDEDLDERDADIAIQGSVSV